MFFPLKIWMESIRHSNSSIQYKRIIEVYNIVLVLILTFLLDLLVQSEFNEIEWLFILILLWALSRGCEQHDTEPEPENWEFKIQN